MPNRRHNRPGSEPPPGIGWCLKGAAMIAVMDATTDYELDDARNAGSL